MLILIAGTTGSGKTWYTKELLKKWGVPESQCLAVDINEEYETEFRFYDHLSLIESAKKLKNKVILFEEATSFFSFNNNREVKRFFTTHRHSGHAIICNFHSLSSIPSDLLMSMDYLYHTETVEKKRPDIFKHVENYTNYSKAEILEGQ